MGAPVEPVSRRPGSNPVRVTFLGTAGSWPTKQRNTSALLVESVGGGVLLDCGEGTVRQLARGGVALDRIETVLVSHFHGDHFLGLPGLLQTMQLQGRTAPVRVGGPAGAARMLEHILGMGTPAVEFPITARELVPGVSVDLGAFTLDTAEVLHPVPALAFRLVGPDSPHPSIVFSGDTAPCPPMVQLARRADLLIHESTGATPVESQMNAWGHSTARQAATVARDASVRSLLLTHFSSRYEDVSPLVAEARAVFAPTRAAQDLLTLSVAATAIHEEATTSPIDTPADGRPR